LLQFEKFKIIGKMPNFTQNEDCVPILDDQTIADDISEPPENEENSSVIITDAEQLAEQRKAKIQFAVGSLMAFCSGLTLTVNAAMIKAEKVDFGELLVIRGLMQIPIMLIIIAIRGLFSYIIWCSSTMF
jgi:hypothetical protein